MGNKYLRSISVFPSLILLGILGVVVVGQVLQPKMVPLLDQPFSSDEQDQITAQLIAWEQTFDIKDDHILVPEADRSRLKGALYYSGILPEDCLISCSFPLDDNSSVFMSAEERETRFLIIKQAELARGIENFPGIKNAKVFINPTGKRSYKNGVPADSISVLLTTTPGANINSNLTTTIADFVASANQNMKRENVTVVTNGQIQKVQPKESPTIGDFQTLKSQYEQYFRNEIISIVEDCNELISVDITPRLNESATELGTVKTQNTLGGISDITVTLLYPESYFAERAKSKLNDDKSPTLAEVQTIKSQKFLQLKEKIIDVIGLHDNEINQKFVVGTYWDLEIPLPSSNIQNDLPKKEHKNTISEQALLEAMVTKPQPNEFQVQDLVEIVVHKVNNHKTNIKTDAERDNSIIAALTDWLRLSGGNLRPGGQSRGDPKIGLKFEKGFKSKRVVRQDTVLARIHAKVIDVRPNGNLLLESVHHVVTDEEEMTITLTGICRSEDIVNNSVLSTQLAQLDLQKHFKWIARDSGNIATTIDQENSNRIDNLKLTGLGLVVGLNGTGDGDLSMTAQPLSVMLSKLGISIDASELNSKNVALVAMTAELDYDIQEGDKFDVEVQSIGSARSLEGGTLLFAPLQDQFPDVNYPIIGMAQGPVTVLDPENPTSGTIIGGAIFEGFSQFGHVTMDKVEKTESIDQKSATLVKHIVKLIGIGLVVGLNGTGDGDSMMTSLPLAEMLSKLGISIDASELNPKNVALVAVTAELNHDIHEGDKFDIKVQSIGSARSLEGGTLLFAPLQGPFPGENSPIIGMAHGPITIIDPEKPTSGTIIDGAIFEGFSGLWHVTLDKVEKTESIDQESATLVKHIGKLIGLGLVVDLDGTGDGDSLVTTNLTANLMSKADNLNELSKLKPENVAYVVITAEITGDKADQLAVRVHSLFSASSLAGGTLSKTYLRCPFPTDERIYGIVQGPVNIPDQNNPTNGVINEGATLTIPLFYSETVLLEQDLDFSDNDILLENLIKQGSSPVLEKVKAFTKARHEILANNVANSDVVGYKMQDLSMVEFIESLQKAEVRLKSGEAGDILQMDDTLHLHWDSEGHLQVEPIEWENHNILFHDENNQFVDKQIMQMIEMLKNVRLYNLAAEHLRHYLNK